MTEEKKQEKTKEEKTKNIPQENNKIKEDKKESRDNEIISNALPDDIQENDKTIKQSSLGEKEKKFIKRKKKKIIKKVNTGTAHIKATYNNTIVTLTDQNGEVISWASAGMAGFKGPKKSTPYAAQIITKIAIEKAKQHGLTEVNVLVNGVGTGRESAVRALNANGLIVTSIKDITPIPHNGCRPSKPRRV